MKKGRPSARKHSKSKDSDKESPSKMRTTKRQKTQEHEEEDKDYEEKEQDWEDAVAAPLNLDREIRMMDESDTMIMDANTPALPILDRSTARSILEKKRRFRKNQQKLNSTIARMQQRFGGNHENQERDSSKFDTYFEDIQSGDLDRIKTAITLLNTELCMSNESMKGLIKPDRFVGVLLAQLDNNFDPSLMVLASNCLLSLIDLFPEISEIIIDENGLKILEEKGKSFEYIDVAEDCVKLLDKIAENCPSEVWQSGSAMNFLNFIDFFDRSVQNIIMDLVKKCITEFYGLEQWNKQMGE